MARKKSVDDLLREAFESVANTPEGQLVLSAVFKATRYDQTCMTYDPATSELNTNATIYNVSKRDVWLALRKYLKPVHRANIENYHQENDNDDRPGKRSDADNRRERSIDPDALDPAGGDDNAASS